MEPIDLLFLNFPYKELKPVLEKYIQIVLNNIINIFPTFVLQLGLCFYRKPSDLRIQVCCSIKKNFFERIKSCTSWLLRIILDTDYYILLLPVRYCWSAAEGTVAHWDSLSPNCPIARTSSPSWQEHPPIHQPNKKIFIEVNNTIYSS